MSFRCRLPLFAIVLTSVACSRFTADPVHEPIVGVADVVNEERSTSLFFAHGIGGYSEGDPDTMVVGIQNRLCLSPEGKPCVRVISQPNPSKRYGCLRRHDFRDPKGALVRVYVLDWRDATWAAKGELRAIDEGSKQDSKRVPMISKLKDEFINSGLADAALYIGEFGSEIRYPFEQSLRWMYQDNKDDPKHRLMVVTFSFGGGLVIDTIEEMMGMSDSKRNDPVAKFVADKFVEQLAGFYMLSSQLPLFELASVRPERADYRFFDTMDCDPDANCQTDCPLPERRNGDLWNWDSSALGHFMSMKRATDPEFQIITFSDPNDLLSYPIFDYRPATDEALTAFVHVDVRNARKAYFGMVNPAKAHQLYGQQERVIDIISYGNQGR